MPTNVAFSLRVLFLKKHIAPMQTEKANVSFDILFIRDILGFPSFSTLQSNYPSYSTYDSDTGMVDHAGLRKWLYYKNTCAMRVSYAMIHSIIVCCHSCGVV